MVYKDFRGLRLSALGFGAMRLPVLEGEGRPIDREQVFRMVDAAMAAGINYYDTAWGYHRGQSEIVLGEALRRHPREDYSFATKLPGYDPSNIPKAREIFEKQLEKTGLDYFDFYLCHNVCELNVGAYLDPANGVLPFLLEQKAAGRIRHLGFSCHGEIGVLERFLDAFGEHMEFCQLQLNYLDWTFQHAKEKYDLVCGRGLPVWVMEPLRGGKLAKLDRRSAALLGSLRPEEPVPAWAFRFLQTLPGVGVTLSGMSSEEQLRANLETFADERPLSAPELDALAAIAEKLSKLLSVSCTACGYCASRCPQQIDIPRMISLYNEHLLTAAAGGMTFIAPMAVRALPEERRPSACLHCRSCETVCPQQIRISDVMADFAKKLG